MNRIRGWSATGKDLGSMVFVRCVSDVSGVCQMCLVCARCVWCVCVRCVWCASDVSGVCQMWLVSVLSGLMSGKVNFGPSVTSGHDHVVTSDFLILIF